MIRISRAVAVRPVLLLGLGLLGKLLWLHPYRCRHRYLLIPLQHRHLCISQRGHTHSLRHRQAASLKAQRLVAGMAVHLLVVVLGLLGQLLWLHPHRATVWPRWQRSCKRCATWDSQTRA